MGKYIPFDEMTEEQIQAELDHEFAVWNEIAQNGCSDPSWPDGANMNLTRNHIIYFYRLLRERRRSQTQISLFDAPGEAPQRPVPPEVPERYMVAGCKYSHRLDKFKEDGLVWGVRGEYSA